MEKIDKKTMREICSILDKHLINFNSEVVEKYNGLEGILSFELKLETKDKKQGEMKGFLIVKE